MKKGIFALITFAIMAFVFVSCDRAGAKTKDHCVKYGGNTPAQTVMVIEQKAYFGILPEARKEAKTVTAYPVISAIGIPLSKHGYSGFNPVQCRKS